MTYKNTSHWNDHTELQCLLIFKKLEELNFPNGKQTELARELSLKTDLTKENINAKITNYKSVAGINKRSNASKNTIKLFQEFSTTSIQELESVISRL